LKSLKKSGFTIIEIVIVVIIIGIIAGIFVDILNNTLNIFSETTDAAHKGNTVQMIFSQLKDEINHSLLITAPTANNLNLVTYESTDSAATAPIEVCYSYIAGRLNKYHGSVNDTAQYSVKFDSITFTVQQNVDTMVYIKLKEGNNDYLLISSSRNK